MTTEHDACDDRIFLRLGEKAALGADAVQWILYRGRDPNPDKPIPDKGLWQGKLWTAGSFDRSTKAVRIRCIREKGLELSPEGRAAMDALADDFDSWRADPARRGTPMAPEALMPLEDAENELPIGPKGRAKPNMIERLEPNCAIGTDGLQWIVFKAVSRPSKWSWQDRQWDAVGYIHSSKRRCSPASRPRA